MVVVVAIAMTNQIAIVVRLGLDDGSVSGHVYRHLNDSTDLASTMEVCIYTS